MLRNGDPSGASTTNESASQRAQGNRWGVAAFLLAAGASLVLLVLPSYAGQSCETTLDHGAGATRCSDTHGTLIEVNGASHVLVAVALPVLIAAVALVSSRAVRIVAAMLLAGFTLITGFSIGSAYLPAVLAAIVAARRTQPARRLPSHASLPAP